MAGTAQVIAGAARRRGGAAVARAGRPAPRVVLYGELAQGLCDRLEAEGHDLAPVARQVLEDVLAHDQEKLARAGHRRRPRHESAPFDPERAREAAELLRD
jgi:hypothetical protein